MQCYSWEKGKVSPGIEITIDKSRGPVVLLGEEGLGRWLEKVELFRRDPPEIEDGMVHQAHPVRISDDSYKQQVYALAKPTDDADCRVLVRIITRWSYYMSTDGIWETVFGAPKTLATGYGAYGIFRRRSGTWRDGIVLMSPEDTVSITPEGGYDTEKYALHLTETGEVESTALSEYLCRYVSRQDAVEFV